jgi:hypothetical protein
LKWAAPAGGGKVLQVVQGTLTTDVSSSSASYVDTGLEVTITPSAATSKILVMVHHDAYISLSTGSDGVAGVFKLLRGATSLQNSTFGYQGHDSRSGYNNYAVVALSYLDSPATTSATTYKTQYSNAIGNFIQSTGSGTNITSIIAMEIGA